MHITGDMTDWQISEEGVILLYNSVFYTVMQKSFYYNIHVIIITTGVYVGYKNNQ